MNLNNFTQYHVIFFKRTIFYTKNSTVTVREVFMNYTKDGVKPNPGIQEIFLIESDKYEEIKKIMPKPTRENVRSYASHSFSTKGYKQF